MYIFSTPRFVSAIPSNFGHLANVLYVTEEFQMHCRLE